MYIRADDGGDRLPWFEVGIVEMIAEDGHVVPEWKALSEGDSWEDAFADTSSRRSNHAY